MKILGISAFYHDSAAALIIDGQIVAAAQEERFTRKKHDEEFPKKYFKDCLDYYSSHNMFIRTTGYVMNDIYSFIFNAIGVEFEDRTSDTIAVFTIKVFLLFLFTLLFIVSCFSTINLLFKHSKNGIDNTIDYKKTFFAYLKNHSHLEKHLFHLIQVVSH